jgi:hypothetical protein
MAQDLDLISRALGPLPVINRFLKRLRLDHFFGKFVPRTDKRLKLAPSVCLGVLLRNVLVAREPLYGLRIGPSVSMSNCSAYLRQRPQPQ